MPNPIKYIETANLLRNDIYSGRFPNGEFLPPEVELCEAYQVGRSTLRKSLAILSKEGFIISKQGVGTMVAPQIPRQQVSVISNPFIEGMDKVYKQLIDELEKLGVKPIEALGADFDPNLHNAVMQEETEEYESGKVCKELQKGYTLNDSVVRHSMVSVAQ